MVVSPFRLLRGNLPPLFSLPRENSKIFPELERAPPCDPRPRVSDPALPDAQGFVPVRMNNLNGKLNITTASKEIETKSGSECEIIYANGVTLRINSAISLEVLKSLILLCQ